MQVDPSGCKRPPRGAHPHLWLRIHLQRRFRLVLLAQHLASPFTEQRAAVQIRSVRWTRLGLVLNEDAQGRHRRVCLRH